MKCFCGKDAGKNKLGIPRTYCSNLCRVADQKDKRDTVIKKKLGIKK